jgi:GT2 family glycosyltransferase
MAQIMFWSTIIATIGRSSLSRSVQSVLEQQAHDIDYEIIVVNDSGQPLPLADWQESKRVTILQTNREDRCVARNMGAAAACGDYFHFLDDDDWMLPGALQKLSTVARSSDAAWVYGAARLVDGDEKLLAVHHIGASGNAFVRVTSGEWLPLQASIIKANYFRKVGGFDVRLNVCQDKDLCRRIALCGDLDYTHAPVTSIVRDRKHSTTDYSRANAYSIWSRNNVLGLQGAFARMRQSANDSYWRGRMVRAYLTCTIWCFHHKRLLLGLGRASQAAAGFVCSAANWHSPAFWKAFAFPHTRKNVY